MPVELVIIDKIWYGLKVWYVKYDDLWDKIINGYCEWVE